MTDCLVSDADYRRYWKGEPAHKSVPVTTWNGEDRRVGATDRRLSLHDRRWDKAKGRRYRLADRRQLS